MTNIRLGLFNVPSGSSANFAYGVTSGIFKKNGLNVSLTYGPSANGSIQQLVGGSQDVILTTMSSTLLAVGKGAHLTEFMSVANKDLTGLVVLDSSGIKTPQDLKGKTIDLPPGSSAAQVFPAYLAKVGLSSSDVKTASVATTAAFTALAQKRFDGVASAYWAFGPVLKAQGVSVHQLNFSDAGVDLMGAGMVAKSSYLAAHPDVARKLVKAVQEATAAAIKDPAAASEAVVQTGGAGSPPEATVEATWDLYQAGLTTPSQAGAPYGTMSAADWDRVKDLCAQYLGLSASVDVTKVYTNAYIS